MRGCARRLAFSTLIAGFTLGAYPDAALGQTDPLIGTWKLDAAKSKFSPGPGPKTLTVTFAAAGEGIKGTADATDAEGKATHSEYTANYDGKDYPITGSAASDTVTLKKVDANTSERIDKKGGKVVTTYIRKVSSDGKTLTVTQTGSDASGQKVNNTLVLEKQ